MRTFSSRRSNLQACFASQGTKLPDSVLHCKSLPSKYSGQPMVTNELSMYRKPSRYRQRFEYVELSPQYSSAWLTRSYLLDRDEGVLRVLHREGRLLVLRGGCRDQLFLSRGFFFERLTMLVDHVEHDKYCLDSHI